MNRIKTNIILIILILFMAAPVSAGSQMNQGGMDMPMSDNSRAGQDIAKHTVEGCTLTYRLIDMRETAKEMPGMTATHHLMVFITDPAGHPVTNATVGFLIEGPEGGEQQVMAMAMGDGYGANVNLSRPGNYTIKAKAMAGDKTLLDAFTYEVTD